MRTPTVLVLALLTMQPRLEAEESITAANRVAMGGGKLKKEDAARLSRTWSTTAHPNAPKGKPDTGGLMAAGFAVRRVKTIKKAKKT